MPARKLHTLGQKLQPSDIYDDSGSAFSNTCCIVVKRTKLASLDVEKVTARTL